MRTTHVLLSLILLLLTVAAAEDEDSDGGDGCDELSVSSNVPLSQLTPNTFTKICPSTGKSSGSSSRKKLGAPVCGDGSAFGFFVSRPLQQYDDSSRILVEFAGGGACWSSQTCNYQADALTFPSTWNKFLGLSCSEIEAYVSSNNNNDENNLPISMLCAKSIGNVNLSRYTTIIVPYCTQDVHAGDNEGVVYNENDDDDDDNNDESLVVNHTGAHNVLAVLRYIYKNFANPRHIVLTGCSAGGTALPLAYHLLHRHYNNHFVSKTQISVIADSPVYLTPTYFMNNAISNWNPWTMAKFLGFRYQKWQDSEEYPTKLWDFVLRKGNNRDQWGFVTHTDDPVSQTYYKWMSGYNNNNDRRKLEENNDEIAEQWWSELSSSLDEIQSRHSNVATFFIDENEGHCSFGLYYPLQTSGFEEWAAEILKEQQRFVGGHNHMGLFLFSAVFGALLTYSIVRFAKRQERRSVTDGDFIKYEEDEDNEQTSATSLSSWKQKARAIAIRLLQQMTNYPGTAGYTVALTVYFWCMILRQGFTHPINNPAIGPSAIALSGYGINNPALVVYKLQIFRLVTSSFLCSGIITFGMAVLFLWCIVRPLEMTINNWCSFGALAGLLIFGTNLIYAVAPGLNNGASCSSMALLLGLNACWIGIRFQIIGSIPWIHTAMSIIAILLLTLIFTFNSWIMLVAALGLGGLFSYGLFDITYDGDYLPEDESIKTNDAGTTIPRFQLRRQWLYGFSSVYTLMFLVLLFRLRRPDTLFVEPFYTGCDLKYSDAVSDFAGNFYGNDDDVDDRRKRQRRRVEQESGDGNNNQICAQFCVPHLLSKGVTFGARRIFDFPIHYGTCEANGYEDHVADRTFKYFSYSLDVEIYQDDSYDEND